MKVTVSTRAKKGAPEQKTVLSIDFTDCPESTIQALAIQALVVKLQGAWRKNGIPSAASVKVKDHAPGTRHQMSAEEIVLSLSPEQFAQMQKAYEARQKGSAAAPIPDAETDEVETEEEQAE